MLNEQGDSLNYQTRESKEERRGREHMHRRSSRLLIKKTSRDGKMTVDPPVDSRSGSIHLQRSAIHRRKMKHRVAYHRRSLKRLKNCLEINARYHSPENLFSSSVVEANHSNLIQISPGTQPHDR
jgi:hypothetical protein